MSQYNAVMNWMCIYFIELGQPTTLYFLKGWSTLSKKKEYPNSYEGKAYHNYKRLLSLQLLPKRANKWVEISNLLLTINYQRKKSILFKVFFFKSRSSFEENKCTKNLHLKKTEAATNYCSFYLGYQ